MSEVTNIILIFESVENELIIKDQLSVFDRPKYTNPLISINDENLPRGWYGGNKMFESNILIGAYNHFPTNQFLAYIKHHIKWKSPEDVLILIKEENDDRFRTLRII